MLRSPDLGRHRDIAVRYQPAYGTLNVCGDWYDVLYTDGLIERRGEDIDIGLARLIDAMAGSGTLPVEELADGLLHRMGVSDGGQDDIALVVVRL
ncbi:SpoIIE family protein phosphatase [Streptomyces purpurascens]|uniref:SpoIIE family protein phosphatase n=1 Tax=Streptomyces purpurascens TaxID=1924 RepID=UPI003C2D58B4